MTELPVPKLGDEELLGPSSSLVGGPFFAGDAPFRRYGKADAGTGDCAAAEGSASSSSDVTRPGKIFRVDEDNDEARDEVETRGGGIRPVSSGVDMVVLRVHEAAQSCRYD